MQYFKVAQTTEVKDGEKRQITLNDNIILLTNVKDAYYAIDNTCTHMGGSLYKGTLNGKHITCPRHGTVFDVTTGEVVQAGKMAFIHVKADSVRTYPVKIEGTDILVGIE